MASCTIPAPAWRRSTSLRRRSGPRSVLHGHHREFPSVCGCCFLSSDVPKKTLHRFQWLSTGEQVQRDFEELPAGAAASLRDSLVELLLRYSAGSPPVRTQLCLAIAALAAHMPPERWAPAAGSVAWLVQRLSAEPQQAALPCLLELLTVLPQARCAPIRPACMQTPRHCLCWRCLFLATAPTHLHAGNLTHGLLLMANHNKAPLLA